MGESLFYAVFVGAVLGVFYDVLRLFRLVLNDKFFLDFLFWLVSSIIVFCYFLIFNSGALRMIYFFVILIGFLLYIFTLGYATKQLEAKLARKLRLCLKKVKNRLKSFKKVLQSKRSIYYNIVANIKGHLSKKSKGGSNGKGNEKEEEELFV